MGLPQIDFRVPEATWFKSALAGRFGGRAGRFSAMPGLSSTGALAWPYKIAVVAVMALVACGTLVTFGSAGAETASASAQAGALPGSDEARPTVEGQVVPPLSTSLLNSADLLSTLNLTDYSPGDTDLFSLSDDDEDDEDSDEEGDDDTQSDIAKKLAAANATPSTKPTPTGTGSPSTEKPAEDEPTEEPTEEPEPVEGSKHKRWAELTDKLEGCLDNAENAGQDWVQKTQESACKGLYQPGSEPDFTS